MVSSPSVSSSANCAASLASAMRAGAQAVAQRERHVVLAHDVADLVEVLVEEALLVMRQAPARHDRAAARDDAGDALRGQRHVAEPHAGVDGEVVDALLGLLDQRVLEHLPVELVGLAVDLLQRLVDRHGADRHRRVAQDPAADVVDVAAGGQVHDRVGAPADRPHQLLDFLGRTRGDGGVADVGVDLHQEVAADDDRLEFRVVDVGGDDGAAARDLVADEFRGDEFGDRGAEVLAVGAAFGGAFQRLLPAQVLAMRDVDHLFGDDAGAGEFELRDQLARLAAEDRMFGRAGGTRRSPDAPPLSTSFTARAAMRSKPRLAIHRRAPAAGRLPGRW